MAAVGKKKAKKEERKVENREVGGTLLQGGGSRDGMVGWEEYIC